MRRVMIVAALVLAGLGAAPATKPHEARAKDGAPPYVAQVLEVSAAEKKSVIERFPKIIRTGNLSPKERDAMRARLAKARDPASILIPAAEDNDDFKVGAICEVGGLKVVQVLTETSMLARVYAHWGVGVDAFVSEFPTVGITDGTGLPAAAFRIVGTKRYETVLGGSKTVLEFTPLSYERWIVRD